MDRKLAYNPDLNKIIAGLSKIYATDSAEFYKLTQFNNIITYFAGEFDEITNNKEFKKIRLKFWRCAFYFGTAYIYVGTNGKMEVLSKIDEGKFQVFETNKFFEIDEDLLAKYQVPLFNVFLQWMDLFKREDDLVQIWYLNALADAKKYKRLINSTDPQQLEEQEANFFNPRKPFIDEFTCLNSATTDTPNNIQPLDVPQSTTHLTFDNIIDHFNFFGDRLGYAVSRENKKERLTSGENFINVHNTNNILRMFVNELEVFCDDLSEKFGVLLEFMKQDDLEEPLASTAPQNQEGEAEDVHN